MTSRPDELGAALDHAMDGLFRLRGVLDPSEVATGLGMSVSEALALRHLTAGAVSQQQLGGHLGLEKSTVSRLVDALVARGWADRAPAPDNRRLRTVRLTADGEHAADAVGEAVRRRHLHVLEQLSEQERAALALALPALVRALSTPAEHGPAGPG